MSALPQDVIDALDPGIRDLVIAINEAGFRTTDSGDGSKAATMACAMPYKNIAFAVERSTDLVSTCDRLYVFCVAHGLDMAEQAHLAGWTVEGTYDAATDSAFVMLTESDGKDVEQFLGPEGGNDV